MSNTVVMGAQWGDEGKGKIVDLLTEKADAIVRFQGGNRITSYNVCYTKLLRHFRAARQRLLQARGQRPALAAQLVRARGDHGHGRNLCSRPLHVEVEAAGGLQGGQGHLVDAQRAVERVLLDLLSYNFV